MAEALIKFLLFPISLILIPIFWGISDGYRILNPIKYSKQWHTNKAIVQFLIGIIVASYSDIKTSLLFAIWFWIVFDIAVSKTRGVPFTHIGKTAFLDRIFPNFWVQFIVKIILLASASFNYFVLNWI